MKKQNFKKVVSLVAGSLVVALVVSISPGSFFVNAAELSKREAKNLALVEFQDKYDDDTAVVKRVKTSHLDEEDPYYIVIVETDEDEFEVIVYVSDGEARLVNDKNLSVEEAKELALAKIKKIIDEDIEDESVEITVNKDHSDDESNPYYTVILELENDDEYEVKVYIETGKVKVVSELKDEIVEDFKDFKDFKDSVKIVDDKDSIKNIDYEAYGINKPTEEASLNQLLKEGKKLAIAEFKDSGDKEAFKAAKDFLKDTKKDAKDIIKNDKKESTKVDEDDDRDDKDDDDKLVEKAKLSEKQALLIALKKINVTINDTQLKRLDVSDDYERIFNLDEIEIELDDDKNPSIYEIELKYDGYEYEIIVHADSGKILDYEKEIDEDRDDKKVPSKVVEEKDEEIDKKDKVNNGNKKDENGNNGKNKEKNKNKNK